MMPPKSQHPTAAVRVATVARRQGSKTALAPVGVQRYSLANGLADLIRFEDALGENAHPTWSASALGDAACAPVAFTTVLNCGDHTVPLHSRGEGGKSQREVSERNERVGYPLQKVQSMGPAHTKLQYADQCKNISWDLREKQFAVNRY
jgi:hypothetical protein